MERQETIVSGSARRGTSCSVCPQTAEHRLSELQRWAWAAATISDPRDRHGQLMLPLLPTTILCASTGHYPHLPSREPVQLATARVLWSRDNFPGRTHGAPQAVAMSHWPLLLQAYPAIQLWLPYPSLSLAWVSKRDLISHCYKPLLSWRGTETWVWPTGRSGAKSKA